MNRRNFLSTLFGGAAAMQLDPERLLWRPGAKLISIPKPAIIATSLDEWWELWVERRILPGNRVIITSDIKRRANMLIWDAVALPAIRNA